MIYSFVSSVGFSKTPQWFKAMFISIFLLTAAAATLMITTEVTYAGNAMCGKRIICRCVRTETDVLGCYT
jgi:hypothetical protein